jgi:hypothetical protein
VTFWRVVVPATRVHAAKDRHDDDNNDNDNRQREDDLDRLIAERGRCSPGCGGVEAASLIATFAREAYLELPRRNLACCLARALS